METIPTQLGVFPLPNTVLFPSTLLPLHVFEPRYRTLVEDALAGTRRIVMAVLKPGFESDYHGSPDVHAVGCVGRIVEHEKLEDGCSDLILKGEAVVHIDSFVSEEPYRTARIRTLPEDQAFAKDPS